ncbi:MAG TPA: hypothetical protein VF255_09480 [Solirubrobacterales bacterium]
MAPKSHPTSGSPPESGRVRRALAWIGENFAKGVIATLAALLVSGTVALVALLFTDEDAESKRKPPPPVHRSNIRFDSWPDGVSARTVILASEETKGLAEIAVEQAKRIASRGLNVGILYSSDYASLTPGFWVAFAGQFDSVEEAQLAVDRYSSQFPTAYQKLIEEK